MVGIFFFLVSIMVFHLSYLLLHRIDFEQFVAA